MLGFLILYCKGMRPMMFQLSGFYCKVHPCKNPKFGGIGVRELWVSTLGFGVRLWPEPLKDSTPLRR